MCGNHVDLTSETEESTRFYKQIAPKCLELQLNPIEKKYQILSWNAGEGGLLLVKQIWHH